MIWDASVDSELLWEEWYHKAADFYEKNGHLRPSAGKLQTWIHAQRSAKKELRGSLSEEQIRRLEQIGMSWDPAEEEWQRMYRYAQAYYQIHQKLYIPCNYVTEDGANLGIWISKQRTGYKNYLTGKRGGGKSFITENRIKLLNDIGMIWDGAAVMGNTSFQEKTLLFYLREYFEETGKYERWQEFGIELDIYLPSIKTAVEYDGCKWHADRADMDEKKGEICKNFGIKLIRIREPGLPAVSRCDWLIELENLEETAFEDGIRRLFEILGLPAPDCRIMRDRPAILDTYRDFTSRSWDRNYREVYQYYSEHGNISIPAKLRSSSGVSLAGWLNTQREAYRNNELTPLQIEKLERTCILWTPFENQWQYMYHLAKAYQKQYGHLKIPHDYKTDTGERLGEWIAKQREKYRAFEQSPRRIYMLEKLGIVWNPAENRRERCWEAAKRYYEKNGDLNIPAKYITEDNIRLGEWLGSQRSLQRRGKMSEDRQKELEKMGVWWAVFNDRWETMFAAAEAYYAANGNLWVPPGYVSPDGGHLGSWIARQRRGGLSADRERRLNGIGMVWDPYTMKWMNKYRLAKAFYLEYGHLNIPCTFITEDGTKLGMWLSSQRQAFHGNPNFLMTPERKRMLEDIGMQWELKFTKPDARRR